MDKGFILMMGKLTLTFAVLLGLPLIDLWIMRRNQRREDQDNEE